MDTPEDWPFEDSPNVAVITTRQVIDEHRPILLVTHDEEDGGWQFLTGETVSEADAKIVALSTIWTLDRSVGELAQLPLAGGHHVARRSIHGRCSSSRDPRATFLRIRSAQGKSVMPA